MVKNVKFDPGAVLDRVIASADPSDSCYLYKLADFRKSGQLVDAFNNGGSKVYNPYNKVSCYVCVTVYQMISLTTERIWFSFTW